jgi:AcrR family transcriptional regulator
VRPAQKTADKGWERRRREILDGAAEVFFERGFHRGTTKEIAEKIGLTQSAIYHYVGAKDDLLAEIARQVDHDFSRALDESIASSDDPVARLRSLIGSFVDMIVLNQKTFAVYWKEQTSIPPAVYEETLADQRRYVRRIEQVVGDVQAMGVLPADRPTHVVAEGIIGMLSWLYWWYRPGVHSTAEIAASFCDLIGLAPVDER